MWQGVYLLERDSVPAQKRTCMLVSGTVVDSKYEIIKVLDQGGMGVIYLANQPDLNRLVILKTLAISALHTEAHSLRFEREAKLLSGLRHANLVLTYSSGRLEDGAPYIAMEYVQGRNLHQELKSFGPMEWTRVCKLGKQICSGLQYAHSHGIVHRDIKPANIVLLESDEELVKIIDFGLGSFIGESGEQTITETGTLLGSPQYMSPEMCSGQKSDFRTDIYSLACMLYECLSGSPPFVSENPISLISRHKNELPESLTRRLNHSLPDTLNAVVLKGLEKRPEDRFQCMDEFSDALDAVLNKTTLHFDAGEVAAVKHLEINQKSNLGAILLSAVLAILVCISVPIILKVRGMNERSAKNSAKDSSFETLLQKVRDNQEQALKAEKRGDKAKAVNLAERALRLFVRELTAPSKDNYSLLSSEIELIDSFHKVGHLIIKPSGQKQLEITSVAREFEEQKKKLHSVGELFALEATIFSDSPIFCSEGLARFCAATNAFSEAKELGLAEIYLAKARKLQEIERDPYLKGKIDVAQCLILYEQGETAKAQQIITSINPPELCSNVLARALLYTDIGSYFKRTKQYDRAKIAYQSALNVGATNDSVLSRIWKAQAELAEIQESKDDAINAYEHLRANAFDHSNLAEYSKYDAKIAALRKSKD